MDTRIYYVTIENKCGEKQVFRVKESLDRIVLVEYLSDNIKKVFIPSEINGKVVDEIGDRCFFSHKEINEISFPNTIKTIGVAAFALCNRLCELILPDSVTEIEQSAFRDCKSLNKIVLSAGLRVLNFGVFSFCSMFNGEVIVPPGLEVIESHAFYSSGSFSINLPDSVKEIKYYAFDQSSPIITTSLTYDKGWVSSWPYGKEIQDNLGRKGTISGFRRVEGRCMILDSVIDGVKRSFFYPPISDDFNFSFVEDEDQKYMEKYKSECKDANRVFNAWLRGWV